MLALCLPWLVPAEKLEFFGRQRKKSNFSHHKILQEGNMLFDTHTHLNNDSFTDEERVALAAEIEASDVGLVMGCGLRRALGAFWRRARKSLSVVLCGHRNAPT